MSIGLGVAIGLFHALASLGISHIAGRFASQKFLTIYFGGVVLRLFLTAGFVVLAVLLAPIQPAGFLIAFSIVFVVGLALEVIWLNRRANARSQNY